MSADQMLAFESDCHIFSGCAFPSPGLQSFVFEPIFKVGGFEFNKPMLLALLSSVVVVAFFWAAFARPRLIPGRMQMIGEAGYEFVRRGVVYDTLGKREGEKFVPLMVSLFFFIWIMNLWAVVPIAQFPVTSIIAFPAGLAAVVYITWMVLTFKRQGFVGGVRNLVGYQQGLGVIAPLVFVLEFLSNALIRPFTHMVRLFANMFAGHLLLLIFTIGTWYLLNGIGIAYAGVSFIMVLVLTAFELFIQALQAYVFVVLASDYIRGAVEGH